MLSKTFTLIGNYPKTDYMFDSSYKFTLGLLLFIHLFYVTLDLIKTNPGSISHTPKILCAVCVYIYNHILVYEIYRYITHKDGEIFCLMWEAGRFGKQTETTTAQRLAILLATNATDRHGAINIQIEKKTIQRCIFSQLTTHTRQIANVSSESLFPIKIYLGNDSMGKALARGFKSKDRGTDMGYSKRIRIMYDMIWITRFDGTLHIFSSNLEVCQQHIPDLFLPLNILVAARALSKFCLAFRKSIGI